MDDGAVYRPSKLTRKFCRNSGLLRMKLPAQSPDLSPIENLWRINKVRVTRRRHRTRDALEIKVAIQEEWERLTEENFGKYCMYCTYMVREYAKTLQAGNKSKW